jgi:hypothetical protein
MGRSCITNGVQAGTCSGRLRALYRIQNSGGCACKGFSVLLTKVDAGYKRLLVKPNCDEMTILRRALFYAILGKNAAVAERQNP